MDLNKAAVEQPIGILERPFYVRIAHRIEDHIDGTNWLRIAWRICAYSYITLIAWIAWQVLPLPGHWSVSREGDKIPVIAQNVYNYFDAFNGSSDCKMYISELYYATASEYRSEAYDYEAFCSNRKSLLQAMSNGGRVGFDAPYITRGCRYRWYSSSELCMILERFDGLIFVGDSSLQSLYNGFNILSRRDLAHGALQTWKMNDKEISDCACQKQFTNANCAQHFITASGQITKNAGNGRKEHYDCSPCEGLSHSILRISAGKPAQSIIDSFKQRLSQTSKSNYKSIPIIHALSPATASHNDASSSLLEFLKLADMSERKTPMLWVGPTAAGHVEIKGRKTNQEIWDFDNIVGNVAVDNGIEVLKMWNMTVQATSWDGMRFGSEVSLVQAMMVINWLSRLESS